VCVWAEQMTLLQREDMLSHEVTRFYVAQMVLAISSIHNMGYSHRGPPPPHHHPPTFLSLRLFAPRLSSCFLCVSLNLYTHVRMGDEVVNIHIDEMVM